MARLSTPPDRLARFESSRVGRVADALRQPMRDAAPWRHWYKTQRWQRLRWKVLVRDNFTCQRTGAVLGGKHPAPDSPVVNHRRPHRGDEALFWDIDNLETVSKQVHDGLIQREEQGSRHQTGIWT